MKAEPTKAMIVEDLYEGRLLLENLLKEYSNIALVASVRTVDEATLAYLKHRPGLVFLDVELDGRTGFEFLENIRGIDNRLKVIFTTAFDHYAVEAIRHAAFDYLLKPLDPYELKLTIQRYFESETPSAFDRNLATLKSSLQNKPLKLNKKHGFVLVNPFDILCCQADWNYTEITLADGVRHLVTINIGKMEKQLPPSDFIRANRSLILNLNHLQQVDKAQKICLLKSGNQEIAIPLTVAKIRKLERLLAAGRNE
jgi:two-component system, LytTR family, response regulator